jgi:hypothetical protein
MQELYLSLGAIKNFNRLMLLCQPIDLACGFDVAKQQNHTKGA